MKSCHRFVGQTAAVLLASGLVASLLPDFAAAQDLSTREKRAAWVLGKCWDKFTPAGRDHLKARLKG